MADRVFSQIGALSPGKSVFDLSYNKKMTLDMGVLYPAICEEAVPGDIWRIGFEAVLRAQPMIAPILHEVNFYVHVFFLPYRILDANWEDFITGGPQGDFAYTLPTWAPGSPAETAKGTLWDYLGLPVNVDPDGAYPLDYIRRAYNRIYNEYYRDQTLISEVAETNTALLNRAWEKDYFTSALPFQQRGTAPALPISGSTSAVWDPASFSFDSQSVSAHEATFESGGPLDPVLRSRTAASIPSWQNNARAMFNANTVDLSQATTFDVSDLRLAFQTQKWLERSARGGARYTEFLRAHFGIAPHDDRLDRPEYVGGVKTPMIVSEVLQTGSTDTTSPQGNLAGHGITVDRQFAGKYRVNEYGLIFGMISLMPRTAYQQGINRQWLRRSRFDFYFPEFAHLSEQAIENAEIFATDVAAENTGIFGYQGRFNEMRYKPDMVCGDMRDTFDYWHLGRVFASAPALNGTFVTSDPSKRIFAVQDEPGFVLNLGNQLRVVRPLPMIAEPGLIDHF